MPPSKILVCVDGSEGARRAMARAVAIASDTGAELIALSAYSAGEGSSGADATLAETTKAYLGHVMRTLLREAPAADAIVDTAEEEGVDLVAMGDRGMTGATRFMVGSVTHAVSHHAPCSVLIAKATPNGVSAGAGSAAYGNILVGTDGSSTSLRAVREAARWSRIQGAGLHILCVYQPIDEELVQLWQREAGPDVAWRLGPSSHADAALEKASAVATEEAVQARTLKEEGDPASTLVRVAEDEAIDLLVVGNVGMTGLTRFLLGSVPDKVSHHAPCDLLIVKTAE